MQAKIFFLPFYIMLHTTMESSVTVVETEQQSHGTAATLQPSSLDVSDLKAASGEEEQLDTTAEGEEQVQQLQAACSIPEPPENFDRAKTILQISEYHRVFPDELNTLKLPSQTQFDRMSDGQIHQMLDSCERTLAVRQSGAMGRQLFLGSLQVVEYSGPYIGMNLKGYTGHVANNKAIMRTWDEVQVKYFTSYVQTDPLLRLGLILGQTALAVDQHNRSQPSPPPRVQEAKKEEFNDL